MSGVAQVDYKLGDKVISRTSYTSQQGNGSIAVGDAGTVLGIQRS
eukprot:COSAG06_NODE_41707_length_388_cov_1.252595_2_plen_44_part_01